MSESIQSFLVEVGWLPDLDSQNKAEAAIKATEERITAENARALAKRTAQENAARQERISAELAAGRELSENDKQFVVEAEKRRRATAEDAHKREVEGAKRSSAVRSEQFKQAEASLLRFTSVAQTVASGISGALSVTPLGGFLLDVTRTAGAMSNLAIQSQRVGASASGIQRYLFAMKQSGVGEGEATSALEGFAKTVKSNPEGYRGLLESWGVKTTDDKGNDLSREEVLANLGRSRLSKESLQQATLEANRLGISGDNAINALRHPDDLQRGYNAYDAKLGAFGLDPNKAAEDARKVDQAYNSLEADLSIVRTKLEAEFFVPVMGAFDGLAKKLEQNPQVIENYSRALEALSVLAAAKVLPVFANLLVKFSGLQAILGTGLGTALGIALNPVVAAGATAESTPTAPVTTDPAERARKLANNTLPAGEMTAEEREAFSKAHGGSLWGWFKDKIGLGGGSGGEDARVKTAIIETAESVKKLADKADDAGAGGAGAGGAMGAAGRVLGWAGRAAGYSPASGGGTTPAKGALKANQKIAYDQFIKDGWSPTAARALVSNDSGEGLAVPGDWHQDGPHMSGGIVQWDPARAAAIKAKFGDVPWKLSVADQARAQSWEIRNNPRFASTLRALQGDNGADMIGALVDNYEGPANRARAKAQRMGYYRGFNPGDGTGAAPKEPTVFVNGTPSSSGPVGDQAALDAQNRIIAGKGRPGDRGLIDRHRQEQNTPTPSDRNPDGSLKLAARTLGRYIGVTRPMAAAGQMPHPHEIGPYHGIAKVEVVKSNLDPAHQKLADAMKASDERMKEMHQHILKAHQEGRSMADVLMHRGHHHLGGSAGMLAALHANRIHHERHGDSFHIHTSDAKAGLDHAVRVSARRSAENRVRNGQG